MNESKQIKTSLVAILELTLINEIKIDGQVLTPEERANVIEIITLSIGSHLGFTGDELLNPLEDADNELIHLAAQLLAKIALYSKEYQKHGETRND